MGFSDRIHVILTFLLVALITSCGKERPGTGIIRPVVKSVETKSGPVIIDDTNPYNGNPGTNSEKISVKGFVIDAYATEDYIDHTSNSPQKKAGRYFTEEVKGGTMAHEQYWINKIPIQFWCWSGLSMDSGLTPEPYASISDSRDFSFTIPGTADNRRDIVMAFAAKTWKEGDPDNIDLTFHHPLVNICFRLSDDFSDNLAITEISLKNIYTQGRFSFSGDGSGSAVFNWTGQASKGNVAENTTGKDIRAVNFFVPAQNLSSESTLSVTFKRIAENEYITSEASVYSGSNPQMQNWSADHYYCYKIKATDSDSSIVLSFDSPIISDWVDNGSTGNQDFMP